MVAGAAAFFECRFTNEVEAGDHVIAMLEVNSLVYDVDASPLLFHMSRLAGLALPAAF